MGLTPREQKLLSQFANNNYGLYNKTLARKLGLHESIFLGEIISEYDYWKKRNSLTEDGYFYSTVDNVQESTTLSDYQQRSIIKHLTDLHIIEVRISGMPAKRFFKIDLERFYDILLEEDCNDDEDKNLTELTACSKESKEQDLNLVKTNNNNITITTNNNNIETVPFTNMSSKSNLLEEGKQSDNKPKKKSNKEQCLDTTYEVIQDPELAKYINSYLLDQQLYKSINSTQWKMRLENIIKYAQGSIDLAKEIVKQTWMRGYRDFYPVANTQTAAKPAYTAITRSEVTNEPPKVSADIIF